MEFGREMTSQDVPVKISKASTDFLFSKSMIEDLSFQKKVCLDDAKLTCANESTYDGASL